MAQMTDETFTQLAVRRSADAPFRKALQSGDARAFHKALSRSLAKAGRRYRKLFADMSPLLWSVETIVDSSDDQRLSALLRLGAEPAEIVEQLVQTATESGELSPFAALVACDMILRSPEEFNGSQLKVVYYALTELTPERLTEMSQSLTFSEEVPQVVALSAQTLILGELSLVLSLLLSPLQQSKMLHTRGLLHLALYMEDSTDNDGTLQAALTADVGQWLAPFVRAAAWSSAFQTDWCGKATRLRYSRAVARIATLTTVDGFLTGRHSRDPDFPESSSELDLLKSAVRFSDVPKSVGDFVTALAEGSKGLRKQRKKKSQDGGKKKKKKTEALSAQSDWASFALLRNRLNVDGDTVCVGWNQQTPRISMAALGSPLMNGDWTSRIEVNGAEVARDDFSCSCWFLDDEVAFVELESKSNQGCCHVRHILLSLDQHFAIVNESFSAGSDDQIRLTSELPLNGLVVAEANSITRDLTLHGEGVSVRAVPMWLDDDRVVQAPGSLEQVNSSLVLTAEGKGGVTLPLMLDWHPDRKASPVDWNRLTVTEDRRVNTPHEASGFRIRIGSLQMVVYRNLQGGRANRAVLGHHTWNESVYGRVESSGDVFPIVMVEPSAPSEETEAAESSD